MVVILCLLVGGLTGYIIGNKTFDKNKDVDNNNNNVMLIPIITIIFKLIFFNQILNLQIFLHRNTTS